MRMSWMVMLLVCISSVSIFVFYLICVWFSYMVYIVFWLRMYQIPYALLLVLWFVFWTVSSLLQFQKMICGFPCLHDVYTRRWFIVQFLSLLSFLFNSIYCTFIILILVLFKLRFTNCGSFV